MSRVAPVLTLPLILISPSALVNSSKHRLPVLSNSPSSSRPPRLITAPSRRAVLGCVVKLPFSAIRTPLFGGRTIARVGICDYYQVYVAPLVGLTPGEGVGEPVEELAFGTLYLRSMNSIR